MRLKSVHFIEPVSIPGAVQSSQSYPPGSDRPDDYAIDLNEQLGMVVIIKRGQPAPRMSPVSNIRQCEPWVDAAEKTDAADKKPAKAKSVGAVE